MARITLKPGHVQPVWAGHPWVYAQAVERVEGGASPGDEVDVVDPRGHLLGRGLYSPGSAIPVRLFSRASIRLDTRLILDRLVAARKRREALGLPSSETDGYRLVHAEGDQLPGLIVDRFGDDAVIQVGTLGMSQRMASILDALGEAIRPRAVVDRSGAAMAKLEGFEPSSGVVRGDPAIGELSFRELGLDFRIPLGLGQKTGYYFDQRPLRERVARLAQDRRVLDVFAYVGSMSLVALRGGAREAVAVDSSALALEVAAETAQRNGLAGRIECVRADAQEYLEHAGRRGGFDLVICDPPKLARSRTSKRAALAAMRRLAAASTRATRPGGLLALCSCSAALGLDDLTRALALGARDVGQRALVLDRVFQGADHPVPSAFPEGLYLVTLIAEIHPS